MSSCWEVTPTDRPSFKDLVRLITELITPANWTDTDAQTGNEPPRSLASSLNEANQDNESAVEETSSTRPGNLLQQATNPTTTPLDNEDPNGQLVEVRSANLAPDEEQVLETDTSSFDSSSEHECIVVVERPMLSGHQWMCVDMCDEHSMYAHRHAHTLHVHTHRINWFSIKYHWNTNNWLNFTEKKTC